ncbi:hypothetical protein P9112_003689 [Eukaryota sp. TZLM1-RC]
MFDLPNSATDLHRQYGGFSLKDMSQHVSSLTADDQSLLCSNVMSVLSSHPPGLQHHPTLGHLLNVSLSLSYALLHTGCRSPTLESLVDLSFSSLPNTEHWEEHLVIKVAKMFLKSSFPKKYLVTGPFFFILGLNTVKEVTELSQSGNAASINNRELRSGQKGKVSLIKMNDLPSLSLLFKHREHLNSIDFSTVSSPFVRSFEQMTSLLFNQSLNQSISDDVISKVAKILTQSEQLLTACWGSIVDNFAKTRQITTKIVKFLLTCFDLVSKSRDEIAKRSFIDTLMCKFSNILSAGLMSNSKLAFSCTVLFLSKIQSNRSTNFKQYDPLVANYFGPLLFRYSNCTNSIVRSRVVTYLSCLFPIYDRNDETMNQDDVINQINRNIELISSSLVDTCPIVRMAGISSSAHIMSSFFDLISRQVMTDWIATISNMTRDKSSPKIRIASLKAIDLLFSSEPFLGSLCYSTFGDVEMAIFDPSHNVRSIALKVYEKHLGLRLKGSNSASVQSKPEIARSLRWSIRQTISDPVTCKLSCSLLTIILCKTLSKKKIFKKLIDFIINDKRAAPVFLHYMPNFLGNSSKSDQGQSELMEIILAQVFSSFPKCEINSELLWDLLLMLYSIVSNSRLRKEQSIILSGLFETCIENFLSILNSFAEDCPKILPLPSDKLFDTSKISVFDLSLNIVRLLLTCLNIQDRNSALEFILPKLQSNLTRIYLCLSVFDGSFEVQGGRHQSINQSNNDIELTTIQVGLTELVKIMENSGELENTIAIELVISLSTAPNFGVISTLPIFKKILDSIRIKADLELEYLCESCGSRQTIDIEKANTIAKYMKILITTMSISINQRDLLIDDWVDFGQSSLLNVVLDWVDFVKSHQNVEHDPNSSVSSIDTSLLLVVPAFVISFVKGTEALTRTGIKGGQLINLIGLVDSLVGHVIDTSPASAQSFRLVLIDFLNDLLLIIKDEVWTNKSDPNLSTFDLVIPNIGLLQQLYQLLFQSCVPVTMISQPCPKFLTNFKNFIYNSTTYLQSIVNSCDTARKDQEILCSKILNFTNGLISPICMSLSKLPLPLTLLPKSPSQLFSTTDSSSYKGLCFVCSAALTGIIACPLLIRALPGIVLEKARKARLLAQGSIILIVSLIEHFSSANIDYKSALSELVKIYDSSLSQMDDGFEIQSDFVNEVRLLL